MKSAYLVSALTLISATVISGCAGNPPQQASPYYSTPYQADNGSHGSIESIQVVRPEATNTGTGAVVGGLVGGLLGNQVGAGNGKAAATVVGVVGGAMVGNNVEKNRNTQTQDMYQIRVRLDNGASATVMQDSIYELRVGSRVRVADGRAVRY